LRRTSAIGGVQAVLCWLIALYIRFVRLTGRWRILGAEPAVARFESGKPLIVALWHGRLLMAPFGWRYSNRSYVLISAHSDGRLIARTLARLGMRAVTGSTRRGGTEALRRMQKILSDGGVVGITPDGPRGPRMRISPGIVQLARLTGAPIYPMTYAASPCRIFDSWDRLVLPLPFCRGLYLWGDPIEISRDADREEMESVRQALEDSLNTLTRRADTEVGQEPVDPAPAPNPPPEPANEAAPS
jgi:lysophospholipid acyltransferase (LPLAT)-like uncharacterized protein